MYKNLFKRVWEILTSPSKTWDHIAQNPEDEKKYLSNYFYPLIGLAAFTAFLNPFISGYDDLEFKATLSVGIQFFIVSFASGFFGFFITAKVLNESFVRWFGISSDKRKTEMLTAYASTPVLVISILTRLLSDFFFMKILFFYVIVLVWEATTHFYSLEDSKRGKFTALASISIIAVPTIVEKIFLFLLPGLK
ncbi:MAG: Yip1 family protein [Bacteroidales bacterium]|nr:Yip1 family protein [Bacteroidales bacterium]